MKRIYVPNTLTIGAESVLDETRFHYVFNVLRFADGEALTLFNGDGFDYSAILRRTHKKQAAVEVLDKQRNQRESPLFSVLLQGISKGDRMDFAIQKACELGVNVILPLSTAFNAVKLDPSRLEKKQAHWQGVIVAACEQSERACLPQLLPVATPAAAILAVDELLAAYTQQTRWLLHPYELSSTDSGEINKLKPTDSGENNLQTSQHAAVLVVGAEGGFHDDEAKLFVEAGFLPKQLGSRILRTETAAVVGLTLLQQQLGDLYVV